MSDQPTFEDMMVRLVAEAMGHKDSELADAFGGYLCACERASWLHLSEFGYRGGCPAGWADARAALSVVPPAEMRHPAGLLGVPHELTDEEFQRIERRWRHAIKAQGSALRIINEDGSHGGWFGRRPPWWKRAYYQVRRWLA